MKNPVRSFLLFAVISASPAILLAAPPQAPSATPQLEQRELPLARRLALSHDQEVQFREIHKDQKAQLEAVQADPSLPPRVRRAKMKEIRATTETKIRAMLNQNQLDEYDQIKRERQERAARRRETTPPPQQ